MSSVDQFLDLESLLSGDSHVDHQEPDSKKHCPNGPSLQPLTVGEFLDNFFEGMGKPNEDTFKKSNKSTMAAINAADAFLEDIENAREEGESNYVNSAAMLMRGTMFTTEGAFALGVELKDAKNDQREGFMNASLMTTIMEMLANSHADLSEKFAQAEGSASASTASLSMFKGSRGHQDVKFNAKNFMFQDMLRFPSCGQSTAQVVAGVVKCEPWFLEGHSQAEKVRALTRKQMSPAV